MENIQLGGLTVSAQGLGAMGMSEFYGQTDWDECVATIRRALDLGRGFLTGTVRPGELGEGDFRRGNPRFAGEAGEKNLAIADAVGAVADARGAAPAQVALAWVYAQAPRLGVQVVPIPGTKRVRWLEQNVGALDVTLSPEEINALDALAGQVTGSRY